MELEPEPEPKLFKSWNRNQNFSKVGTGTGTVKNSYGSTTLHFFVTLPLVACLLWRGCCCPWPATARPPLPGLYLPLLLLLGFRKYLIMMKFSNFRELKLAKKLTWQRIWGKGNFAIDSFFGTI
jgi:hypothetical protein